MVMAAAFSGILFALFGTQAGAVQMRVAGHQNRDGDGDADAKHVLCTGSHFTRDSGWPECGDAPWKPPAVASKTHEMCIDGKALPKLYVLGAQKTGTSSLANDLACAGVFPVPSAGGNEKEFSYFTGRMHWNGIDEEKSKWRELLPQCSYSAEADTTETQSSVRMVADMTPNNLRMVPGETTYGSSEFVNLPNTLLSFYRHQSKHITFVAMIREPLSRMQSAWYAARECDNHAICTRDCNGTSFNADLRKAVLNAHKEKPLYTEWLWTGMYGRQLEQWLKKFDAKQMYVVPYLQYSKGDADSICRDLSERADFHMDCDGQARGKGVSHSWSSGEHPSLEGDIMPKVRADFDVLMNVEKDLLVRVLAEGNKNGMGLANYNHEVGDEAEIRAWLETWW